MKKSLKLAVLGSPIAHSRTPGLQESFARDAGISEFSCERIETDCSSLKATVYRLIHEGYDGFNCTMPLKGDMSELADEIDREASLLRSVNTVAVRDGRLFARTTDGGGILLTLKRAFNGDSSLSGKKVMLLGAGGAARSTALSLGISGAELTIYNRTPESAESLSAMLAKIADENLDLPRGLANTGCRGFDAATLCEAARDADILINCTAVGMSGKPEFESLDFIGELPSHAVVVDAVYNPLKTRLLQAAEERGLIAMSGLWMLVYQGALSFGFWTGETPDEDACKRAFERISDGL